MEPRLRLEDVPPLHGPRPERMVSVRRPRARPWGTLTRRVFLTRAVGVGVGTGIALVGLLPPARRAGATHKLVDGSASRILNFGTYGCANVSFYNFNVDSACNEACGPSDVHTSACFTSGTWSGWHKDHTTGSTWTLRPDECAPEDDFADGWKWIVENPCGCSSGNGRSQFRCHDGKHNHGTASNPIWHASICQKRINCSPTGSN